MTIRQCLSIGAFAMASFALGHRTDEYLQATTMSLGAKQINLQIRLTPGMAVYHLLAPKIDSNHDGKLSASEQSAYASKVISDLVLKLDNQRLEIELSKSRFPTLEEMKAGSGEIILDLHSDAENLNKAKLIVFENHHESTVAAYQENIIVPDVQGLSVISQHRNYDQSRFEVNLRHDRSGLRVLMPLMWISVSLIACWTILKSWRAFSAQ